MYFYKQGKKWLFMLRRKAFLTLIKSRGTLDAGKRTGMKRIFIINPVAGPKNSADLLRPMIAAAAKTCPDPVEVLLTTHAGHAGEIVERCADTGEPVAVYACGGDGTLNEVIQVAAGKPWVMVGCVPCGSGNDFVRNFGSREAFLDIQAQLEATPCRIDTIHTEYGYSAAICAAGLDAKVAYGIPKFKRLPGCGGSMAYKLSIVEVFFGPLTSRLRVVLDGREQVGEYLMAAICNGRVYGGGYSAAPYAMMDDGWLDVVLVRTIPRLKIPGFLAKYKDGLHLTEDGQVQPDFRPYMTFCRVKSVTLENLGKNPLIVTLDGECAPRKVLHAEICPKNLTVLLPKNLEPARMALQRP